MKKINKHMLFLGIFILTLSFLVTETLNQPNINQYKQNPIRNDIPMNQNKLNTLFDLRNIEEYLIIIVILNKEITVIGTKIESLIIMIDGKVITLHGISLGNSIAKPSKWIGQKDFKPGGVYLFDIHANTTDESIEKKVYFTIPQDMLVDFPAEITGGVVNLSWVLYPDNMNDNQYTRLNLRIGKYINPILPDQRFISIPADTIINIQNPRFGIIDFRYTNFYISDSILIIGGRSTVASYSNGVKRR